MRPSGCRILREYRNLRMSALQAFLLHSSPGLKVDGYGFADSAPCRRILGAREFPPQITDPPGDLEAKEDEREPGEARVIAPVVVDIAPI